MRPTFAIALVALVALFAAATPQFVPAVPYAWSSDILVNVTGVNNIPGTRSLISICNVTNSFAETCSRNEINGTLTEKKFSAVLGVLRNSYLTAMNRVDISIWGSKGTQIRRNSSVRRVHSEFSPFSENCSLCRDCQIPSNLPTTY